MTRRPANFIITLASVLLAAACFLAPKLYSNNRLSQIVFPFTSKRTFSQSYHPATNTLTLEIANTRPHELSALDYYDDQLIRRVLVRDMGAAGSEVNLTLKDKSITATVTSFEEPFRIVIDVFDRHYQVENDPITGLPIATVDDEPEFLTAQPSSSDLQFVVPQDHEVSPQTSRSDNAEPRRLLQPTPQLLHSPDELRASLSELKPGIGAFWDQFPPYIYRVQTAAYHDNHDKDAWYKQHADKALSSAEAMADYAGKLYDFGHENRALVAYQQVLYKDPSLFDKDPMHLWKFAETHFGQGNLTLADGYYQALIVKQPNHDLSYFARLRRLDVNAIKATQQGQNTELQKLATSLSSIQLPDNAEIQAQAAIRRAFWHGLATSSAAALNDPSYIPPLDGPIQNEIRNLLPHVEGQKTAFIASSTLLNSMLSGNDPWNRNTGKLAAEYLKRFSGNAAEPYRSLLSQKVLTKVKSAIQELAAANRHLEIIKTYEELPASLKTVKDDPMTAWQVGESYRTLGQTDASIPFYQQAASKLPEGPYRFKANFWLAYMAGKARHSLKISQRDPNRIAYLGQLSRAADSAMANSWNNLKAAEKDQLLIAMKSDLASSMNDAILLSTPPSVLLEGYSQSLSVRLNASATEATSIASSYSPSASTVRLLSAVAARFNQLQQTQKRRQTLELLRHIKPADIANDQKAKELWAQELLTLADDYRSDNQYLEAGQTYAFAGTHAEDFAQRAESLYKGALLLYRSGRRNDAIQAFQKCSEDGNDRYYANLCTERLDRLNNQ